MHHKTGKEIMYEILNTQKTLQNLTCLFVNVIYNCSFEQKCNK